MQACQSSAMCGIVDRHPSEKKELQELAKKKQKLEGELKAIASEISIKEKLSSDHNQSFEARIHDILIRTNPEKYLTSNCRPKEGIILADTYILKKYYGGQNPNKQTIEKDSEIFQTIIKSYEEKMSVNKPKNSVVKQLENHGIRWPNVQTGFYPYYYPQCYVQTVPGSVQQFSDVQGNIFGSPSVPRSGSVPVASPPPPYMEEYSPPLPPQIDDKPPLPTADTD